MKFSKFQTEVLNKYTFQIYDKILAVIACFIKSRVRFILVLLKLELQAIIIENNKTTANTN